MAGFEDLTEEQKQALARAGHKLFHNPDISPEAKRLLMRADPSVSFPELKAQEETHAQLAERDKQIEELRNKMMEDDARRQRAELHAMARERGLSPADVEKTVTEYKVMDWEKAMEITERLQQIAPASAENSYDHVHKLPDDKKLWQDPNAFARDEAHRVIDELRGRRRPN